MKLRGKQLTRSVFRSPNSTASRLLGGFDSDALDYFSRAEALGGSFDQSAVNATYTETYVKTAISNFISGCKTDGIWDKLTECYLLAGTSFDGLTAKLKYDSVATLTNTNFVSGDYVAAGSGSGLKGDAGSKLLDTSYAVSNLTSGNGSLGVYATEEHSFGSGRAILSAIDGSDGPLFSAAPSVHYYDSSSATPGGTNAFASSTGMQVWSNKYGYSNGVKGAISDQSFSGTTASFSLLGRTGSSSNCRLTFAHIGTGLTDTEVANLSTRVNALMAALGANAY